MNNQEQFSTCFDVVMKKSDSLFTGQKIKKSVKYFYISFFCIFLYDQYDRWSRVTFYRLRKGWFSDDWEAKIVVSQRLIQPNQSKSQSLLKDFSPATNYVSLPYIDLLSNTSSSSSLSGICLSFFFLFGQKLTTHCVCLFVCLCFCLFVLSFCLTLWNASPRPFRSGQSIT